MQGKDEYTPMSLKLFEMAEEIEAQHSVFTRIRNSDVRGPHPRAQRDRRHDAQESARFFLAECLDG